MRRFGSVVAAMALTLAMVGAANAAPRSTFNGDFDIAVNGEVVGHIVAKLWSTNFGGPAGSYSSSSPGLGVSQAQVGEATFYHQENLNEVYFKALEIGYPGGGLLPRYGIFVGHFVDALDPNDTDFVEFWTRPITGGDQVDDFTLDPALYFRFDVAGGAFVLHVAP